LFVLHCDAAEIFEAVESRPDPPAFLMAALLVVDPVLPAARAWNDRLDAALAPLATSKVGNEAIAVFITALPVKVSF
jgi:hypothetical protein